MTATMKNAAISARILAAISNGATLEQAVDQLLGSGTFERLAGDLYDTLRP